MREIMTNKALWLKVYLPIFIVLIVLGAGLGSYFLFFDKEETLAPPVSNEMAMSTQDKEISKYMKFEYDVMSGTYTIVRMTESKADLTIPATYRGNKVVKIENMAFRNNDIENLVIENGIQIIGIQAFWNCEIQNLIIPESVVSIGSACFAKNPIQTIEIAEYNDFYYVANNCLIEKKNQKLILGAANSNIPSAISSIDSYAFFGNTGLTEITIPAFVSNIGDFAFSECVNLTRLIFGIGDCEIGSDAFSGCDNLQYVYIASGNKNFSNSSWLYDSNVFEMYLDCSLSYVNFPKSLRKLTLGPNAVLGNGFSYCENLISVTLLDGVKSIPSSCFSNCYSLLEINIPESVTSIGSNAFYECRKLSSIIFEDRTSPLFFGEEVFYNCLGIESFNIKSQYSFGSYAFGNCIGLKSVTFEDEYHVPTGMFSGCVSLSTVTSNGFSYIGNYAFKDCKNLASLTIDGTITSIGNGAFQNCSKLSSINISNSVETIGSYAFDNCSSLYSVTIGNGVKELPDYLFKGCNLNTLTIGSGITRVSTNAFSECSIKYLNVNYETISGDFKNQTELIQLNIGENVKTIDYDSFLNCTSLRSLYIPANVTYISDTAFKSCSGLSSITVASSNTEYRSEGNCLIQSNKVILGCMNSVIPDNIKEIGSYAFYDCVGLKNLVIPSSVNSIGYYAFYNNGQLESIEVAEGNYYFRSENNCLIKDNNVILGCKNSIIPTSVVGISVYAFLGCDELLSITIPSSVTSIDSSAFENCYGLTEIIVDENNTTYRSENNCLIEKATNALVFGCINSVIPESVTKINSYAFRGSGITEIVIPNSVTTIEMFAFYNCKYLTDVTIGKGVTRIESDCFFNCPIEMLSLNYNSIGSEFSGFSSLKTLYILENVNTINSSAFYNCNNLENISIGDNVSSIDNSVFSYCENIKSLTIGSGINYIASNAFHNCIIESLYLNYSSVNNGFSNNVKILNLKLGDNVNSVGDELFKDTGIESIEIGSGLNYVSNRAFYGVSNTLKTISVSEENSYYYVESGCLIYKPTKTIILGCNTSVIPNDIKNIESYAFYKCESLTSIVLPKTITQIGAYAFDGCRALKKIEFDADIVWKQLNFGDSWLGSFADGTKEIYIYTTDRISTLTALAKLNQLSNKKYLSINIYKSMMEYVGDNYGFLQIRAIEE